MTDWYGMKKFPKWITFTYPRRPYQARVLQALEEHIDDNHLHIVAAPWSWKTVLWLEAMIRIDKPTLILAPTLTIRNQWIDRFTKLFLQEETVPDRISSNIHKPEFITVSTYQWLHVAITWKQTSHTTEWDDVEEESDQVVQWDIIKKLTTLWVKTLIIDEAHHMRKERRKSLTTLKDAIDRSFLISLTATPPYDVSPTERERYHSLCGPIDEEISVPELVKKKNLCPHQDFVYFNELWSHESTIVSNFHKNIEDFYSKLLTHKQLVSYFQNHPFVVQTEKLLQEVLDSPRYSSAIVIYLHACGLSSSTNTLRNVLGVTTKHIPEFAYEYAEELLEHFFYKDKYISDNSKLLQRELKSHLKKIGWIEKKQVYLQQNSKVKWILLRNSWKLKSISDIVLHEEKSLGTKLRCVILADYIRVDLLPKDKWWESALHKLWVIPIFEEIRRTTHITKIAVLTWSIVIVPTESINKLISVAHSEWIPDSHITYTICWHDKKFSSVQFGWENRKHIVAVITELFNIWHIKVLVWTAALLWEGRDAPTINSLILASYVWSFMLSNQMRGRAIRVDPNNSDKVSNIWHLTTIDTFNPTWWHDMHTLERRMKSFVWVSVDWKRIENWLDRLHISLLDSNTYHELATNKQWINHQSLRSQTDFSVLIKKWVLWHYVDSSNKTTLELSWDRWKTSSLRTQALQSWEIMELVPEIETPKEALPRSFIFWNTIEAVFWTGVWIASQILAFWLQWVPEWSDFKTVLVIVWICSALWIPFIVYYAWKSLLLFVKNWPISWNLKSIGKAVLYTLRKFEYISSDIRKLQVRTSKELWKWRRRCYLEWWSLYEKNLFTDTLKDILNPIENPRYLLVRKSLLKNIIRKDYHTVPKLFAKNKEQAEYFSTMRSKYIWVNDLIYTRTKQWRAMLIKARNASLSSSFVPKATRLNVWR